MPVSFSGWLSDFRDALSESPRRAARQALYRSYLGLWYTLTTRVGHGRNVYERDWDLLVVLEACRVDALRELAAEYEFLESDNIERVPSVGCSSHEWLVKTFTTDYSDSVAETAHVTANEFAEPAFENGRHGPLVSVPFGWPRRNVVDESAFTVLEHVTRFVSDEPRDDVPPGYLTECAIAAGRSTDADRIVAHYDRPRHPGLTELVGDDAPTGVAAGPWHALESNGVSRDIAWERYLESLRSVLDEVQVLLENVDARRTVITADHGAAFGEWGVYGHPDGAAIAPVKDVPWAETTATDTGWRTPTIELGGPADD